MPKAAAAAEARARGARHRGVCSSARPAPSTARRRSRRVELDDGAASLPADLVVMAVGIRAEHGARRDRRPRRQSRHRRRRRDCRPSAPDIYAIGECAEHRGTCYGLVEPAYEQARVLASGAGGRDAHATRAPCSRPTSRSRASTCSRPAISTARGTEHDRRARRRGRAPTASSWCARTARRRRAGRRYARRALVSST